MTHPVNPRSFGMKFIALAHVTTYTRPPFYSLGGLGTRLPRPYHPVEEPTERTVVSCMFIQYCVTVHELNPYTWCVYSFTHLSIILFFLLSSLLVLFRIEDDLYAQWGEVSRSHLISVQSCMYCVMMSVVTCSECGLVRSLCSCTLSFLLLLIIYENKAIPASPTLQR